MVGDSSLHTGHAIAVDHAIVADKHQIHEMSLGK